MAERNGARLVIINREATEFDEMADLVVREDIGTVLSPFIVHHLAAVVKMYTAIHLFWPAHAFWPFPFAAE